MLESIKPPRSDSDLIEFLCSTHGDVHTLNGQVGQLVTNVWWSLVQIEDYAFSLFNRDALYLVEGEHKAGLDLEGSLG